MIKQPEPAGTHDEAEAWGLDSGDEGIYEMPEDAARAHANEDLVLVFMKDGRWHEAD